MKDLIIREAEAGEENFIYNSWLHSYRSSHFARPIESRTYYKFHHAVIERILARPTCSVLIATHKDTPTIILGYMVLDSLTSPTIHFVYVKQPFRRLGIAKALLEQCRPKGGGMESALEAIYTHKTQDGEGLIASTENSKFQYIPYLI